MGGDKGGAGKRMATQIRKDSGGRNDGGAAMMGHVKKVVSQQSKRSKRGK